MNRGTPGISLGVDVRMCQSSGIGRYLQNILPSVLQNLAVTPVTLLGKPVESTGLPMLPQGLHFAGYESSIYTIREQIEFYPRRNSFSLFWSPHYNVPIAHRGKLLVTIHDLNHLHIRAAHKRLYAELMFRAVKRKASMILTNSEFTANEIRSRLGIPHTKIVITLSGVDDFWRTASTGETPHPKPYLLYVGNVKPHKNLARLVGAFKLLSERIPHDLVVVGKTDGFITADKRVQESAKELGSRIFFAGQTNDAELKRFYSHATALVFPSLFEGFGLPPLEAMACGCPVTASRITSIPEVCGDAALYFDPYDVTDMASKIKQMVDEKSLRDDLRVKGLERSRMFHWGTCAAGTTEVIKNLLSN